MSVHPQSTGVGELQAVVNDIVAGKPMDREAARKALETLNREREELAKRIGVREWSAELLSDLRND